MRARLLNSIVLVGFSVCLSCCNKEPSDDLQPESSPIPLDDGVPPEQEEQDSDAEPVEEPVPVKIERRESDFDAGRVSDVMFVRLFADDFPARSHFAATTQCRAVNQQHPRTPCASSRRSLLRSNAEKCLTT